MNITKLITTIGISSVLALTVNADLIKDAGLKPIPSSEKAQLELIDNDINPLTQEKVELGKKLYFNPRLSKSGLISCNTCHNL